MLGNHSAKKLHSQPKDTLRDSFFEMFEIFIHLYVCLSTCKYAHVYVGACGNQKSVSDFPHARGTCDGELPDLRVGN